MGLVESSYVAVRRYILEGRDGPVGSSENSEDRDQGAADRHDETAHGGNIAIDTHILMSMKKENNPRLEQCRRKYLQMYDVDYETIMDDIWDAPAVVKIYDYRAHLRLMKRWVCAKGDDASLATNIRAKCDQAISSWESWVKGPKTDSPPELDEAAPEIRELYLQHSS